MLRSGNICRRTQVYWVGAGENDPHANARGRRNTRDRGNSDGAPGKTGGVHIRWPEAISAVQ